MSAGIDKDDAERLARRDLAFECCFEISSLAGAVKKMFAEGDERPVVHGIMSRIEQMCTCVDLLMKLHGDDDNAYQFDFDNVKAMYEGRGL